MLKLQIDDLNFILKKTKLSLRSLLNLIEEERDYNLVLDSISSTLTEEEKSRLCNLSPTLKVKLCIYNCSQHVDFDIAEKSYISEILSKNYNFIYKNGYVLNKSNKREVKQLLSVIKQNKSDNQTLNHMAANFNKIGKRDIATHVPQWLKIINKSREILSVNTCN